jgi:hypothetical protein
MRLVVLTQHLEIVLIEFTPVSTKEDDAHKVMGFILLCQPSFRARYKQRGYV